MLLTAPAPIAPKPTTMNTPVVSVSPSGVLATKAGGAGATPPPTSKAPAGAAGGSGGSPDAAKMIVMPTSEALSNVAKNLDAVLGLTVGGGTKQGTEAAVKAAGLLRDSSMLVQLAHRNGLVETKRMSPELEMNLIMVSTGLSAAAGQVASVGASSAKPMPLKEALGEPMKQASEVLAVLKDHVARNGKAAPVSSNGYL